MHPITIRDYLNEKRIRYSERGNELMTHCVFADCDKDSKGNEAHLYFNSQTGQYQCKKCLAEGNILTLMKHLGDEPKNYDIAGHEKLIPPLKNTPTKKNAIDEALVTKCNKALPDTIRQYLYNRGLTDSVIEKYQLGYGTFHGQTWITIPVRNVAGEILFFKLRRSPEREEGNKYMFYPSGNESQLFGQKCLIDNDDYVFICEGEFDQMILEREGLPAITSTAGAGTFKSEWIEKLKDIKTVFLALDNDEAGQLGAEKLAKTLSARFPYIEIRTVKVPPEMGRDITDYFLAGGGVDGLVGPYSERTSGIDISRFPEMRGSDVTEILDLTIKHDNFNKLIVFLAMLSAFTEESQINVLLNAPSSTGKSFIPMETIDLFPPENVIKILYASQTSFFHESGEYNKEKNEKHIHLERKIIIFIDQPRTDLLARLRPILSHDEKEMICKITDKTGQGGNQTKNIVIHGYPVAIYCTASCGLDEQEATRFFLISPEIGHEKFHDTISAKIDHAGDNAVDQALIENNPARILLKERIEYIRDSHINDVIITDAQEVKRIFFRDKKDLKPRHQRDISRFLGLIKAFTLLNLPNRKRVGDNLYAEKQDIIEATKVWEHFAPGQEHNIAPYVLELYKSVFVPAYREYNKSQADFLTPDHAVGVPRKYILRKHFEVMKRNLSDASWRQDIEPTLINAGLIVAENVGRNIILSPTEDIEWYPLSHS